MREGKNRKVQKWIQVILKDMYLKLKVIGEMTVQVIEKTKQNKTKQNKTKQNKTKQNKTKQNKTKQNKIKATSNKKPENGIKKYQPKYSAPKVYDEGLFVYFFETQIYQYDQ
jgi:hypothetical protein